MRGKYKERNLDYLVERYKEDHGLSHTDLLKEIKSVLRNLKLHKEKKFLGFYDTLMNFFQTNNRYFASFNTKTGRAMFASFVSLFLMSFLGLLVPAFIINLYSNDGELIYVLWIITFICTSVAVYERNYMWARLAIITFSISAGIFTAYLYNAGRIEENVNMNISDITALSLAIAAALIVVFETILNRLWKKQ